MKNRSMGIAVMALLGAAAGAAEPPAAQRPAVKQAEGADASRRLERDGVVVDFSIERQGPPISAAAPLLDGDFAEVRFRISDAATGEPLRGRRPAAWMDVGGGAQGDDLARRECKDKVALYLKGIVGIRPMIDLNSYFLAVLNRDPSITIIDPVVSMTGKTSLFATVVLEKPGADWARSADHKRLFVSMPRAGKVAAVDTDTFRVVAAAAAGKEPTRVALSRDGRTLWVGNDAKDAADGGVTVLDAETLAVAGRIATGRGHHEIAHSVDGRFAFVTNRDDGTVSVVDAARLVKVKDVRTGPVPLAVAVSTLSHAAYVADGKDGTIAVLDPARHEVVSRVATKPGLGPLRFTEDGRWGFAVNPVEHAVFVVDAGANAVAHVVRVDGKPYQVSFTPTYAYVRLLDSERVQMIGLASLGAGKKPTVQSFAAGTGAPQAVRDLSLADAVSRATTDNAVFVANPVENATYFYMEGMNAPSGSFVNYGHQARAVTVVDRSLKEAEPGLYAGKLRIPAAGRYDVAFLLDAPRVLHCFSAEAKENPALQEKLGPLAVEYLELPNRVPAGATVPLRIRLTDPRTRAPRAGLADVRVLHYRAPGHDRTEVPAQEIGGGVYEAAVRTVGPGAYYVYVSAPSLEVRWSDLPYRSIVAVQDVRRPKAKAALARERARP